MAVALIGIVVIQYFWIDKTIEEKQQLLDNNVLQAVNAVEEQLNDQRALTFISDSILNDIDLEELIIMGDSHIVHHEIKSEGDHDVEIKVMSSFSTNEELQEEQVIIENHHNRIVHVETDSQHANNWTPDLGHLESVINKMKIEIHGSHEDIRLDSVHLEQLLRAEFEARQVGEIEQWAIYDHSKQDFLIAQIHSEQASYKIPLFSTDIMDPGRFELQLKLNKSGVVMEQVWGMIALSLCFSLILLIVFVMSIKMILKHKKISQIKSDFINNMTHEFKTPLASISLAADSLLHPNTAMTSDNLKRYVTIIKEEKDKLNNQVERILEVAALSKDALEIDTTALLSTHIIENAIGKLDLLAQKSRADITFSCDEPYEIIANQFHLENVLINIIENAIKYAKDHPQIQVSCTREEEQLCIQVKDNGIGMSKEQLARVFDNFYRAQTGDLHATKGFGLGLSYCKLILEQMNGAIKIDSELKVGTTVNVLIPLA